MGYRMERDAVVCTMAQTFERFEVSSNYKELGIV